MSGAEPDFSEELVCSICLELFCQPVILGCGHNYCRACICQVWGGKAVYSCPECRQEFPEPRLIANRVLKNLVEKAQASPAMQRAARDMQHKLAQQQQQRHPEAASTPEVATVGAEQTCFGDRSEWYFGPVDRAEADALLRGQPQGTFLVRDSASIQGDYVLSIRENKKARHYIIHSHAGKLTMGSKEFADFTSLLAFYTTHYLETASLTEPLFRALSLCTESAAPPGGKGALWVKALYDFQELQADNLPFREGEVLKVLNQTEEQWWMAQNSEGKQGMIPLPYVRRIFNNVM